MTEGQFIQQMKDAVLDTDDEITMESQLGDIEEWDSLALVSFIAMANTSGKSLNKETIKKAITVRDLYGLLQG